MTDLVSLLFIAMIPIDCKITIFSLNLCIIIATIHRTTLHKLLYYVEFLVQHTKSIFIILLWKDIHEVYLHLDSGLFESKQSLKHAKDLSFIHGEVEVNALC